MRTSQFPATLRRLWAADLTTAQLYALLKLRGEVFVMEQTCLYLDLDERDLEPSTRHFWLETDGHSAPVAYLRLLEEADGTFRIGRVCTARAARGCGFSRRLVEAALVDVGGAPCVLDAQVYVADFYSTFGFEPEGDEFIEDGIPHLRMRR